ncbi:MAG: prepilin peptidase, partial [Brevundimonas sp.]
MIPLLQTALLLVFPALVIAAAMRDVTSYTIPNWMSGLLILGFFAAALALGLAPQVIGLHAAIGAGALVAGMAMFALNWIGGGDAKLFAAAGLWLGWPASLDYLMVTGVAGGVLTLVLLGLRSTHLQGYTQMGPAWFGRLATPGESVP